MQLDITNNFEKSYKTKTQEEEEMERKKSFKWSQFFKSLNISQISLIVLVFAILYFVDYLNFFNSMQGFLTPSPVLGMTTTSSNKKKSKK